MGRRSGKFYSKNEKEVMKKLGLEPTEGSGSGWIQKEDGENEHVLGQLKSTDARSIAIKLLDIQKLEYHATVSHKIPVFFTEFLETGDIFLLCRPEHLPALTKYLETGEYSAAENVAEFLSEEKQLQPQKVIKTGNRDKFWEEKEKERAANKNKNRRKI